MGGWRLPWFGDAPGRGVLFLESKKKGGARSGLMGGDPVGFDPIRELFVFGAWERGRVVSRAFEVYPDWVSR
eukprot:2786603-Heterocapsa_arctica.AAC.1